MQGALQPPIPTGEFSAEIQTTRRWLLLAAGVIVMAGAFAGLLVVARTPPFDRLVTDPGFFRRVLRDLPEHLELVEAKRGGEVIAGAINVASKTHLYGRYWGCFEEHPFLHFHVCLYHSIDDSIRAGRTTFEPGAGGEHKISRGFEPTRVHSAHRLFDPRFEHAVKRATEREAAEIDRVAAQSLEISGLKPWSQPGS